MFLDVCNGELAIVGDFQFASDEVEHGGLILDRAVVSGFALGRREQTVESIGSCAKPRSGPGIRPNRKNARPCARPRTARGGLMFGVSALPSKSAPMGVCPSAQNVCAWKNGKRPPKRLLTEE
jgi:hypothetical protein